ncbi:MAG: alpha/beta fold hydrolase [Rhizobiaceae bacterium]|nr:alpha/beta fold hydrolase [Rhizobiaceae bacterium]
MRLFALEAGGSGPAVVLLHGFGGSHATWDAVIPLLSQHCRILAYDLPGHRNSHPWPETAKPKVAVDAVLADLTRRGIEQFHVAGHSMGGAIAVLMALEAPQRVASMSLFAPGGFGPQINARLLARSAEAVSHAELRATLEAMTGWDTPVDDDVVAALAAWRAADGQADALVALSRTITRDGRQGAIPRERMAGLSMPVAVCWGTIDNVLPVAQTAALPPQFALHLLEGVGHMLPQEVPDFVSELIARNMR